MSLGMLFVLLSVNPPAFAPAPSVSEGVRIAQLEAPILNSQPAPIPEGIGSVAPPAMGRGPGAGVLGYDDRSIDGLSSPGSCCGELDMGLSAGWMAAPGCYGWFDDGSVSCGGVCGRGCGHGDPATHIRCRAAWNLSPGDMYPNRPYFPVCHGHYYFRPYHFSDIWKQQQLAARWGADPSSPYSSNDLFTQVYLEMGIPETVGPEALPSPTRVKTKPSDHFRAIKSY